MLNTFSEIQSKLVSWCLTTLPAQTVYIVPQEYEIHHAGSRDNTNKAYN